MYKLFKEKGYSDITLKNMETFAEISLGRYTVTMQAILRTDGYHVDNADITGDKSIKSMDSWSLEISDDVAKDLNNLARRGTKTPIRHQAKQKTEKKQEMKTGKKIDLFDFIFNDED